MAYALDRSTIQAVRERAEREQRPMSRIADELLRRGLGLDDAAKDGGPNRAA
jgi:hypothetical protein